MLCDTGVRLCEEWDSATKEMSDAVTALTHHIGIVSKAEHVTMLARIEPTRLRSENARMSLELHRESVAVNSWCVQIKYD
jgi:hypothetical protein